MSGKIREGFIDWLVIDNVFNISIDLTWSKETYNDKVKTGSILGFYNSSEEVRANLYERYDNLKEAICR